MGGGVTTSNISVSQIRMYLEKLVGDGPQPEWGVPQGWHLYVAHLLSWASGRHVSSTDAMDVVMRWTAGRSYELNWATLARIGIDPTEWELPLSRGAPAAAHHHHQDLRDLNQKTTVPTATATATVPGSAFGKRGAAGAAPGVPAAKRGARPNVEVPEAPEELQGAVEKAGMVLDWDEETEDEEG